jgi:hypothetical protein
MRVGPSTEVALLERDDERRLLSSAVGHARNGNGGVVLVEGEAGVGKTRLLHLAGELAALSDMRVLRTRGSELDRAFGARRPLVRR